MNPVFRYLASPDNRPLYVALGLGCCVILWGMRVPGYDWVWMIAGLSIFTLALLFILLRITTRLVAAHRKQKRESTPRIMDGVRAWLLYPSAVVFLVLLGVNRLPFKLAWALSRPSLDRFARSYDPEEKNAGKRRIGLFTFSSADDHEGHLQFTFDKQEVPWGKRGFYFSPSGAPIDSSHFYDQQALGDGWYAWHYSGW